MGNTETTAEEQSLGLQERKGGPIESDSRTHPLPETQTTARAAKKWRRLIGRIARFLLLVIAGLPRALWRFCVRVHLFGLEPTSIEKIKNYSPP